MTEFLVELYVARANTAGVERDAERTRLAAEELSREGTPVRYLRSIFVPEDETCFFLYEADSIEAVRETVRRADLTFARIVEAVAPGVLEGVEPCS